MQVYSPCLDDEVMFFCAEDKVVAFAVWRALIEEAELLSIAVSTDYQRQGLARLLFTQLMQGWQQKALKQVFLEVRESNHAAQNLYQSMGFVMTHRRRQYYSPLQGIGDREDAILMQKEI